MAVSVGMLCCLAQLLLVDVYCHLACKVSCAVVGLDVCVVQVHNGALVGCAQQPCRSPSYLARQGDGSDVLAFLASHSSTMAALPVCVAPT